MGISEEEIAEAVLYASAVSAGVVYHMAKRAGEKSQPGNGQTPFNQIF